MKGWRYYGELLIKHASFKNFRTFRAEEISKIGFKKKEIVIR